jgi:hypothetical protein
LYVKSETVAGDQRVAECDHAQAVEAFTQVELHCAGMSADVERARHALDTIRPVAVTRVGGGWKLERSSSIVGSLSSSSVAIAYTLTDRPTLHPCREKAL